MVNARAVGIIPTRLVFDTRPVWLPDCSDAVWVLEQGIPSRFAGGDDRVVAVSDKATEPISSQVFLDVLHWVQFWRIQRQRQQGDVVWTCGWPPV